MNDAANIEFDPRGVPISKRFDDPYYCFQNGLDESRYVFLQGNELERRLRADFQIAELGFGTGLNFFLCWDLWRRLGQKDKIYFTSFERYPISDETRSKALGIFPQIAHLLSEFNLNKSTQSFENSEISLQVILGDARKTLPKWHGKADAWFLDGFSPAKNPELWELQIFSQLQAHSKHGTTASTYSATGHVRRNFLKAGFEVKRIAGYGSKRHMLKAQFAAASNLSGRA